MGFAKINAPEMSEKETNIFVRKNIRSLDGVISTGICHVVEPEYKREPDEELIEDEKGAWGGDELEAHSFSNED